MSSRQLAVVAAVWALGVVLAASTRADVLASKRAAEVMKRKVAAITALGDLPSKQARRTTVTETEVNAYLTYEAHEQ